MMEHKYGPASHRDPVCSRTSCPSLFAPISLWKKAEHFWRPSGRDTDRRKSFLSVSRQDPRPVQTENLQEATSRGIGSFFSWSICCAEQVPRMALDRHASDSPLTKRELARRVCFALMITSMWLGLNGAVLWGINEFGSRIRLVEDYGDFITTMEDFGIPMQDPRTPMPLEWDSLNEGVE